MQSLNRGIVTTLLVGLLASPALATVYFQNDGTKTGWSNYPQSPENKGRIDQVSSPTYKGSTALRMEQTYDSAWALAGHGFHAEVVKTNAQSLNTDRYYGGAFMLPSTWSTIDNNVTFQQFS